MKTFAHIVRFILIFGVFVVAPLFVTGFLLEESRRLTEAQEERDATFAQQERLRQVISALQPERLLQRRFRGLARLLLERRADDAAFIRAWKNAQHSLGVTLEIYRFDRFGRLDTPAGIPLRSRRFGQWFWNDLLEEPVSPLWEKSRADLIGKDHGIKELRRRRGVVTPLTIKGERGALWWELDRWSQAGGLVLIVRTLPDPFEVLKRRKRVPPALADLSLLIMEEDGAWKSWGTALTDAQQVMPELLAASLDRRCLWPIADGRLWVAVGSGGATWYAGSPANERGDSQRWLVFILFIALGMAGGRICWSWIIGGQDIRVSLRFKLVGLFLFALLVPFLGGAHLTWQLLRDRAEIEATEIYTASNAALARIDEGFLLERKHLLRLFKRVYDNFLTLHRQPAAFKRWSRNLINQGRCDGVIIRDLQGKYLGEWGETSHESYREERMFEIVSKACVERRLGTADAKAAPPIDEMVFREIIEDPSTGLLPLLDLPSVVHTIRFSNTQFWEIWDVVPESCRPVAMVAISQLPEIAAERYLTNALGRRQSTREAAIRVGACRTDRRAFYPSPMGRHSGIQGMVRNVQLLGSAFRTRLMIRGKSWLAVGRPCQHIDGFTLFALVPEEIITHRLSGMRKSALAVGGVALLIALLIGLVLADTFLVPISELGAGIAALARRDTRWRLSVPQKDEFGDLAVAFNALMENFGEVNEAQIVQRELFPREALSVGGYRAFGISRPATELGGDYFDFQPLGDGTRMLAVIGDVSGHGIPAALVMAMAKTVVTQLRHETSDPEVIFEKLNRVLFETMKRRRLMTLSALWIDTTTHQARLFNFGHTDPLWRHGNDGSETLVARGRPLGFAVPLKGTPVNLAMAPGDRLIFFTDGLAESLAEESNDAFRDLAVYLSGRPSLPIEDACRDILDEHPFVRSGRPQPDDFTVLIVERQA